MRFYQKAWRIYTVDLTPCSPNMPRHPNEPQSISYWIAAKCDLQRNCIWKWAPKSESKRVKTRRTIIGYGGLAIRLLNAHSRPDQNKGPLDCLVACLDTCSLWLALCSDKTLSALWNLPVGVFSLESSLRTCCTVPVVLVWFNVMRYSEWITAVMDIPAGISAD